MQQDKEPPPADWFPLIGLCASCRHVKVIQSAKGSKFVMCNLAKSDRRLNKYPSLPVIACFGYKQNSIALSGE